MRFARNGDSGAMAAFLAIPCFRGGASAIDLMFDCHAGSVDRPPLHTSLGAHARWGKCANFARRVSRKEPRHTLRGIRLSAFRQPRPKSKSAFVPSLGGARGASPFRTG